MRIPAPPHRLLILGSWLTLGFRRKAEKLVGGFLILWLNIRGGKGRGRGTVLFSIFVYDVCVFYSYTKVTHAQNRIASHIQYSALRVLCGWPWRTAVCETPKHQLLQHCRAAATSTTFEWPIHDAEL